MKATFHLALVAAVAAVSLFRVGGVQADENTDKLEALRRAMTSSPSPAEEGAPAAPKKKVRTRAIVFDNDPQSGAAETAPPPSPSTRSGPPDCSTISPDVKANAVDFAIQFKVGSAELSPVSAGTLIEIAKILSLSPERCVLVEGHTDATGNADKNMALSRDRANSVVKFISEKGGLDLKRLVPIGKGASAPIPNLDPRDAKNRRVVFKVVAG